MRTLFAIAAAVVIATTAALGQPAEKIVNAFGTIPQIQQYPWPTGNNVVAVQGLTAAGDGNGGVFAYDPTSNVSTNATNIFASRVVPGRIIRQFGGTSSTGTGNLVATGSANIGDIFTASSTNGTAGVWSAIQANSTNQISTPFASFPSFQSFRVPGTITNVSAGGLALNAGIWADITVTPTATTAGIDLYSGYGGRVYYNGPSNNVANLFGANTYSVFDSPNHSVNSLIGSSTTATLLSGSSTSKVVGESAAGDDEVNGIISQTYVGWVGVGGDNAWGIRIENGDLDNYGTNVFTIAGGVLIGNPAIDDVGGFLEFDAIRIRDITAATTNYAIRTGLGKVSLGDGAGSLATDAAVTIASGGWTNSLGKNAQVSADGTGLTYTIYLANGTAVYTNAATVTHFDATLQPGGKVLITAGSDISGRAWPW